MLEGINYWDAVRESPSQLETCFAIFVNVLELDDRGDPVNEKHAEYRAAAWLYRYCTGELTQPELHPFQVGNRAVDQADLAREGEESRPSVDLAVMAD